VLKYWKDKLILAYQVKFQILALINLANHSLRNKILSKHFLMWIEDFLKDIVKIVSDLICLYLLCENSFVIF
jgi:hypothetical protein